MNDILTILRFIMLLLSLFGAAVFLRKRTKIAYAFCMPLACAMIVCILFFFSLFMQITAIIWILFGAGILMLGYVILRREICRADILNRTNLFLLIGIVVLALILAGRHFVYVDDFTHWATLARAVVEQQGLPDAGESFLSFVSYPPASALWICFFSDITGSVSEDVWLFGQAFFMLALMSSLTHYPDRKSEPEDASRKSRGVMTALRILSFLFLLGFCCFAMRCGGTVLSLYVDGLLMAAGLSGTAFLLLSEQPVYQKAFLSIPLTLLMMLLKDTGFVFVLSVFVILIYQAVKERKVLPNVKNKNVLSILIVFFSVVITEFLWRLHVAMAFPDGGFVRGAEHQLPHNSPEQLRLILHGFFHGKKLFFLIGFLLALLLFYLIWYAILKKTDPAQASTAVRFLLFSAVHFLVYDAGLLYVYLFRMPFMQSAQILEFNRYMSIEILYLIGVGFCFAVRILSAACIQGQAAADAGNRKRNIIILLILLIAADLLLAAELFVWFTRSAEYPVYEGSLREKIHELNTEDYRGDLLYYAPSLEENSFDDYILYWYSYYEFRTTDSVLFRSGQDLEQAVSEHSHLLIYDVDERITQFMHEHGFSGEIKPGIYDIG